MRLASINPYKNNIVHVVIETPQYSVNQYGYDSEVKDFCLKKTLSGNTFPFDFGFIPNTLCDDGDPIAALVLMEGQTYPGFIVAARLIGMLKTTEIDENNKPIQNDRLIAVSIESHLYSNIKDVKDLNKNLIRDIEKFFIQYNKHEHKVIKPLKWNNAESAFKKVHACKE